MPIIRVELFPGRSHATKMQIAEGITRLLEDTAGIPAAATTVLFHEVAPTDWVVAGKPYASPDRSDA